MNPFSSFDPAAESAKIITFIRDTFKQTGKQTAVIALSGGIDSATSLFLTVKALGPEHVEGFHLPAKNSNPIHLIDAQATACAAGLKTEQFHVLPIGAVIQKSWRIIQHSTNGNNTSGVSRSTPDMNKLRLANIAARTRMIMIYDQAKKYDALVIGTENYSEHLLGYFTRFGDEASDIEPIRQLYKTEVTELAQALGVPQTVIEKQPSADLWRGQTDAGELGFSYTEADPILALIDANKTDDAIEAAGFDRNLVAAVRHQVQISDFKHHVPYMV